MRSDRLSHRLLQTDWLRLYLPAALCFLVVNITNRNILDRMLRFGLIHGTGARLALNYDLKAHFILIPLKTVIFGLGVATLLLPIFRSYATATRTLLNRRDILRALGSLGMALLLTATLLPMSSGLFYSERSTDPFNQHVDQLYRRLLIPALAHLVHLDGMLYVFVFWLIVVAAWLLVVAYLKADSVQLTRVQEVSFLSVGIFVSAYQVPGYPDIAIFLLGLIALMDYEHLRHFSRTQAACFALALMAHEAGAVIVFLPLCLFVFGWRSWSSNLVLFAMYVLALLSNFSFHVTDVVHAQTMVGEISAHDYFWRSPRTVAWAALLAFKLFWILVPIGLYYQFKSRPAYAWFVLTGFGLALASTYIAVDYSRLVGFATIPFLLCLVQASRHLSSRTLQAISICNLVIPSFYLGANTGLVPFYGLYYLVYKHVWHLALPGIR